MTVKKENKPEKIDQRDIVRVNFQTGYYNIVDVLGVVDRANRQGSFPYRIKLLDENGKPVNKGHDDDGGEPGSGNIIYVEAENLTLVEKYVPKRLEGDAKQNWKVGDKFMVKKDFSMAQDDTDDMTGVVEEMVKMKGMELTVVAIVTKLGPKWLVDGTENYCWLPEWVDAVK